MILYYAIGGGLGHLSRARRVLDALRITDAAIVTASPYADDSRVRGAVPVFRIPAKLERDPDEHARFLRRLLRETRAERLIADTFPVGIHGELADLDVPIDLVARLLRWNVYREAVPQALPPIETAYAVEELTADHETALRARSGRFVPLDLTPERVEEREDEGYWLVVHSGPEEEVRELIDWMGELRRLAEVRPSRVVVASQCVPPSDFERVDVYPASALFPAASRIVSAAGFNVILETEQWAHKHDVLPFARKFDDQFLRASRRRARLRDLTTSSHAGRTRDQNETAGDDHHADRSRGAVAGQPLDRHRRRDGGHGAQVHHAGDE